jgi:hypothetical protein
MLDAGCTLKAARAARFHREKSQIQLPMPDAALNAMISKP